MGCTWPFTLIFSDIWQIFTLAFICHVFTSCVFSPLSPNQASPSVTTQPLPFGLEREKHIDMLFRAFHRQIRPTTDTQDLTPVLQDTGRTRGEDGGPAWKETVNDSKRLGKLSALKTVTRLHITARPELQGE